MHSSRFVYSVNSLLNWNHSKYGGGNMPSISDFPPAGKMPSGNTMSNCWNIEGCHLLICFFKKFPLVRKPCRHSTFAFLPCSMRTPQGAAQVETTSWNLKYRGACGSWYLPRRGCTLPSPNKILVATYPKQNKTTDKTAFCCNQFLNSVHIMHLTLKQSFSCDSE